MYFPTKSTKTKENLKTHVGEKISRQTKSKVIIYILTLLSHPASADLSFYERENIPLEKRMHPNSESMYFLEHDNGGNCSACSWIAAEGKITKDTPYDFIDFLKKNPSYSYAPPIVALNSHGGDVVGAIQLGELFREIGATVTINHTSTENGISNYAPGVCRSACSLAFLGGKIRLANGGELGVHQFSVNDEISSDFASNLTDDQRRVIDLFLTSSIVGFLERMGVSRYFYERLSGTEPEGMYYFTERELLDFSIISDPLKATFEWKMLPYENGLVTQAEVPQSSLFPNGGVMRFYCSKGSVLLTYIFEHADRSKFSRGSPYEIHQYIVDSIEDTQLFLEADSIVLNHQLLLEEFNHRSKTSVFAFEIYNGSVSSLLLAKNFNSAFSSNVATVSQGWLGVFNIGKLPKDNRALMIALNNCIN